MSVRLRILLGGFNNQFGWLFLGFGLVFVWVFGGSSALHDLAFFSGELAVTEGTVSAVIETNVSLNDETIYKYRYSYVVDNVTYTGVTKAFRGRYKEKDNAVVEYSVRDHGRSRIQGLSISTGMAFLIALLFPLVGLIFISLGVRKGLRGGRILRDGKQAQAYWSRGKLPVFK